MSAHRQRPIIEGDTIREGRYGYSSQVVPRTQFLLSLEGWYSQENGLPDFKLSCRYRDLLRCSVFNGHSRHFYSCFRPGAESEEQPWRRCSAENFAIVYVPDKHGNFMGRAFIHQPYSWGETLYAKRLILDKVYGNALDYSQVIIALQAKGVDCHYSRDDSYL